MMIPETAHGTRSYTRDIDAYHLLISEVISETLFHMQLSLDNAEQQFAAAYDRYADAIFRHCTFRLLDRERGRDLMQETFLKTWEYVARGNAIDNVQAFLYRAANNLVIDEVRRRKKRVEVSLEDMQEAGMDIGTDEHERSMKSRIDEQRILSLLQKIDEPYREVLVMRYIDELPPAQIAKILGASANVVSVRINRGMKKLQSLLADAWS